MSIAVLLNKGLPEKNPFVCKLKPKNYFYTIDFISYL